MSFELLVSLFIQYGYWIVFVGILLDNAGLPLPGELLLLSFGALARTEHVDLGLGILIATAAAISGDSAAYWLGRLGGERLLHTYCRATLGSGKCVQKAVAFYYSRGKTTVVFGRFVMGVRAFLFPLAGSARMPYAQFLLFDSVGALLWAGLFILAGYSVGWQVHDRYRTASMMVAGLLGASFAGYFLTKLYRRWRHGPAFLRQRMITRVGKALQSSPRLRTLIPKPSEMVRVGSNGTGQADQQLFPGEDGGGARPSRLERKPGRRRG